MRRVIRRVAEGPERRILPGEYQRPMTLKARHTDRTEGQERQ